LFTNINLFVVINRNPNRVGVCNTLLLILSHLNAFVLGGISNVYAANQVVDATKSPTTYIEATANGVDLINIANPNSVRLVF
jgi:hypothetical protein